MKIYNNEKIMIGITGGVGAGKTEVVNILLNKGYHVIVTDSLTKDIIKSDKQTQNKIINSFGNESFIDGIYNTKYIASVVFSQPDKLTLLNQIIHPVVITKLIEIIDQLQSTTLKNNLLFIESALLYELSLEEGFDYIISVNAPLKIRKQRLITNRNLTENQITQILTNQLSQEEKNKYADFVIENNNSLSELEKTISNLLKILTLLPNKN